MLCKNFPDIIILYIHTINLVSAVNGRIWIISSVHIIWLVYDHCPCRKDKCLEPESVILERSSRCLIVTNAVFFQKFSLINATPGVHNIIYSCRSLRRVKYFIIISGIIRKMIISKLHISIIVVAFKAIEIRLYKIQIVFLCNLV